MTKTRDGSLKTSVMLVWDQCSGIRVLDGQKGMPLTITRVQTMPVHRVEKAIAIECSRRERFLGFQGV